MGAAASPRQSPTKKDLLEQHLELLRQGITAARSDNKAGARSLFRRAIAIDGNQEVTWLWLASVGESQREVQTCMERILRINPDHQQATKWLRQARALAASARVATAAQSAPTAAQSSPTATEALPATGSAEPEPARAKVILAVDDSPTVRKLVATTLERQGYQVVSAADGLQALAKLQELTPDLILLDITMPNLDGYQICRVIKANDQTAAIPVVMLSGKDGFFDKVRGRQAGAVDYITKPFEAQTLLHVLNKNLEPSNDQQDGRRRA